MQPVNFSESNTPFRPPPDMTDGQCGTVHAYRGTTQSGSLDGVDLVVVAWKPDALDLKRLNEDGVIYLACVGGLPPHLLCTSFKQALNPA